jgi:hypothetical protein
MVVLLGVLIESDCQLSGVFHFGVTSLLPMETFYALRRQSSVRYRTHAELWQNRHVYSK